MALIKCPECNREISEYAEVCPKCGIRLQSLALVAIKKGMNAILDIAAFGVAFTQKLMEELKPKKKEEKE